jgi:phosphate/sulfate permease
MFGDMVEARWAIFGFIWIAVVLGFVWVALLRGFASCMVWTTIMAVVLATFALTIYTWTVTKDAKDELDLIPADRRADDDDDNYKALLGLAVIFTIITVRVFRGRILTV